MTNLDIIEFIDEFLREQEDVLHGIEGRDCTKSRKYLDMIKKQLSIRVVSQRELLINYNNYLYAEYFGADFDDADVDVFLEQMCN